MNRRGFLKAFAGVPIAAALAPALLEELLPSRTIFLPPAGGWILGLEPMVATVSENGVLADLLRDTLRHYAGELARNVSDENVLLRHLMRKPDLHLAGVPIYFDQAPELAPGEFYLYQP